MAIRVAGVLGALAVVLCLLEIVFRVLPTSDSLRTQPVDRNSPYMHFEPHRALTLSKGKYFSIVTHKRTNNYGFLSDVDYGRSDTTKLVVIGDSYVEGFQVANQDTLHGLLNAVDGLEVYGIGASGSPLSQYLAYAQFAMREFNPGALWIVVVGNDFDESLLQYNPSRGFHLFKKTGGSYQSVLVDYEPSRLTVAMRYSALARYLFMNVGLQSPGQILRAGARRDPEFVGNAPRRVSQERLDESMKAVDFFLEGIRTAAAGVPVLFVLDGMRPQLYSESGLAAARGSYFDLMRSYFTTEAAGSGFEVVDLQTHFIAHHRQHGERFEFDTDAHWNERGHRVAADAVAGTATFHGLIKRASSANPTYRTGRGAVDVVRRSGGITRSLGVNSGTAAQIRSMSAVISRATDAR